MNSQPDIMKLCVPNRMQSLVGIGLFMDKLFVAWRLPRTLGIPLNVAVEEAFTHIVQHAFPDGGTHDIEITFSRTPGRLNIIFTNDGVAYNPLAATGQEIGLPQNTRDTGSMGIFLVNKMMDKVSYCRRGHQNILTLEKKLDHDMN